MAHRFIREFMGWMMIMMVVIVMLVVCIRIVETGTNKVSPQSGEMEEEDICTLPTNDRYEAQVRTGNEGKFKTRRKRDRTAVLNNCSRRSSFNDQMAKGIQKRSGKSINKLVENTNGRKIQMELE